MVVVAVRSMLSIPTNLPSQVKVILEAYLCLPLGGKCVPCPYWIKKKRPFFLDLRYGVGKGNPEEIKKSAVTAANRIGFDFEGYRIEEIRAFMRRKAIGVDCSGFAYHILDAFEKSFEGRGLGGKLKLTPSFKPWSWFLPNQHRINADYLTRPENTVKIEALNEIKPGDLIRTQGGKHVMVILEKLPKQIIYAHSSHYTTKVKGVHLHSIAIKNPEAGLGDQEWKEITADGHNYGQKYFNPENDDGVYRLRIWA